MKIVGKKEKWRQYKSEFHIFDYANNFLSLDSGMQYKQKIFVTSEDLFKNRVFFYLSGKENIFVRHCDG